MIQKTSANTSAEDQTRPIVRGEGVNESERHLKDLCEHSFLKMWSHPSVYSDTRPPDGKGDGEENCDLLVVFENHILIFQDKSCKFKDSGDLSLDWSRWYRDTVLAATKQIWRAEGRIKKNPKGLFLDKECTQPFFIPLPEMANAEFHRIVVAHGASERCRKELGGTGSLMLNIDNTGVTTKDISEGKILFTVGHVDVSRGFVHIFDDYTLDILLKTLDTISDFVAYLTKKEKFLCSIPLLSATGEEELLAEYLKKMNEQQEHDFINEKSYKGAIYLEGSWEEFCSNPQRLEQLKRNEISYGWDALIEEFTEHTLARTQYFSTHSISEMEYAYRFLARENRTRRYMLMDGFYGLINKTPSSDRGVRIIQPSFLGDPYYIFMLFPRFEGHSEEEYRIARRNHLEQYCLVVKAKFPDAEHIVGIAINSDVTHGVSEDLICLDVREWSTEMQEQALTIQKEFNILNDVRMLQRHVKEYPDVPNA